jgi:CRISPR-associated endoribonuclease Cas6
MPPDLLSLILTLRPARPVAEVPFLGRAAHALLLDAIRWADADLAEQLHAGSELRSFTVSDLIGVPRKVGLQVERTYTLRLTTLTTAATEALSKTLTPAPLTLAKRSERSEESGRGDGGEGGPLSPGSTVELGQIPFRIEAVDAGPNPKSKIQNPKPEIHHPWSGATTYEALSAPWLLGRLTPPRSVKLHFASPTTFKSEGRHVPVPLPSLVFGSLLERWNAFAPVALPPEVRRFAGECLALSAYELRSRGVQVKDGGLRMGGQGWARFTATTYDRYWLSLIQLLSDFAFYAGVGAQTTMGFGQCRVIEREG